jgi:tetratricopeptide (TPR) repeat protein
LGAAREYDKAIAAYAAAVELDPTLEEAYFGRSGIHGGRPDIEKRKLELAIADLDRVLQLRPGDFSALFNRAGYHRQAKRFDSALRDYTEILEGKTDFSRHVSGKSACQAVAHCYRGEVYLWQTREYDRAAEDFTAAVKLDPKITADNPIYYSRARAYLGRKEYAKARADFAAELKLRPDSVATLNECAWLCATCPDAKARDGRKAVELAERANKLSGGKDAVVLDTLAAAYADAGEFEKAVEWQKRAIELIGPKPGERAKPMETRLAEYKSKKPHRDQ